MANTRRENRLNGLFPLSYVGVIPVAPQNFIMDTRAPTSTDVQNFYIGDIWLDYSTDTAAGGYVAPTIGNLWILVSKDRHVATWINFLGAAGTVITLTGNDGLPATALAGNINIKGDGTFINITRSPDIHSLLVSPGPNGLVQSLTGNSGGAVFPTAGNINILGTGVITVVGNPGTSTLTITPSGAIASSFPTDSGTATPALGVLNIIAGNSTLNSGSSVKFTGSGNTVLLNVTDANSSVIIGQGAGNLTMAGSAGTSVGVGVLSLAGLTTGGGHTAVGYGSLQANTTGVDSCAFGNLSLNSNTTGILNSAFGFQSLRFVTTGSHNSGFGEQILSSLVTGSYNCAIGGNGTGGSYTGAESSNIVIMNSGVVGESNVMRIGTSGAGNGQVNKCFVAGIRGITTGVNDAVAVLVDSADQLGTVSSSIRYKQNVEDMASASDDLYNLRPVLFEYKDHPGIKQYGLIAEEVKEHLPRLVVNDQDGIPLSIKYHELPVLLLNELQKLQKRVEFLEKKLEDKSA